MKKCHRVLLIIVIYNQSISYSQKSDTAYYQGTDSIYAISDWDSNKEKIHLRKWSMNGTLLDDVYCKFENNRYTPIENSKTYFGNGKIHKEFTVSKNKNNHTILTYDKEGNCTEKWQSDILKNEIIYTTYYLNGYKSKELFSKLPQNKNGFHLGLWYGGSNPSTIYQRDVVGAHSIIEFHSNGKQLCTKNFKSSAEGIGFFEEKYFDTTGTIDTSTYNKTINDPYRGSKIVKQGTWYSYFTSGQIEKIENYKNGKREGEQKYWFENGQLEVFVIVANGKYNIVEKYDKDGKSIK